jgi:hypothetical protein
MIDIEDFSKETFKFAKEMGYVKDWSRDGCYIHLEASGLIGALRDKENSIKEPGRIEVLRGKEDPIKKLGDLLISIFSVCGNYDISVIDGIEYAKRKMEKIQNMKAFKNRGLR